MPTPITGPAADQTDARVGIVVRQGPRSCAVRPCAERLAQGAPDAGRNRTLERESGPSDARDSEPRALRRATRAARRWSKSTRPARTCRRARPCSEHSCCPATVRGSLEVARKETSPELRREAINQLGVSGGRDELWQIYQQEKDGRRETRDHQRAVRRRRRTSSSTQLATKEADPDLRREAIEKLGLTGQQSRAHAEDHLRAPRRTRRSSARC